MPTNGDHDHVQRLKRGYDSVATRKARDAPWRARRQPGARARVHAQLPWEIRKLNMHLSIERVRLKLTLPKKNRVRLINQEEATRIQEPERMESLHDVLLDDWPCRMEEQPHETV
jgi:hypothetical protein